MKSRLADVSAVSLAAALVAAVCLGTAASQAQTTLADFPFNEGTGATTHSATNDLTGTLGVAPNPDNLPEITTDSPSGAAGDTAVQLRGTGFLLVDDSSSPVLALQTEPFTMETWVKWDAAETEQYNGILAYGQSYKLGLNNTEIIWTLLGVVDVPSGLYLPQDGGWHHVAAAYEPGMGVTIYLDGTPSFVAATQAMRAFQNNLFSIGSEGLGNSILATLDRVRVHKGLLTADQLDTNPTAPKALLADTIVAYDFNEAAMPFQNAKAPARPTMTSEGYFSQATAPSFSTDSPTGGAGDYAMEFPSAGRRVIVPDPNAAITLDTGDFTVEAWVKFGAQPQARSVLFFNSGPGAAVSFSVNNRTVFVTTLGILDVPSAAAIPDDGGWHHIAVVHENGKEFRFYVDGILGDTVAYTQGVLIGVRTDTQFYIGSEPTGGLPYVGKIDRLRVHRGIVAAENLDYRVIPGVDPAAPALSIQTVVEVAWPTLPAGYILQSTTTVADPNSWTNVPGTPTAQDGNYKFYFPPAAEKTFYRLVKP